MTVKQNDFGDLLAGDLPGATQAQHMFRMFTAARIPHAGLAGEERLKPFALEVIKEGDGGNTGISVAA